MPIAKTCAICFNVVKGWFIQHNMLVNNMFLKFGFNGANSRTMSCNVGSFVEQWDARIKI